MDSTNATKTGILVQHELLIPKTGILVQHELLVPKTGILDRLRFAGPSAMSSHSTVNS